MRDQPCIWHWLGTRKLLRASPAPPVAIPSDRLFVSDAVRNEAPPLSWPRAGAAGQPAWSGVSWR